MNTLAVYFMCLASVLSSALATNYCSTSICSAGAKHIACDHTGKFGPKCPSNAAMVNITAALRTTIVNVHNTKRNLIAGGFVATHEPACRMATMQWNKELASLAALNVRQCAMSHDQCRNTDAFKYSGQNLAWVSFTGTPDYNALFRQTMNMWYNEVKDSNMTYINSFPNNYNGPAIGHFTVMMAERNIRVGCAAATYSVTGATYKAFLIACNYATTNMINFPIYASCSKAAKSCTKGKNSKYPNLCSKAEVYNVNKW